MWIRNFSKDSAILVSLDQKRTFVLFGSSIQDHKVSENLSSKKRYYGLPRFFIRIF